MYRVSKKLIVTITNLNLPQSYSRNLPISFRHRSSVNIANVMRAFALRYFIFDCLGTLFRLLVYRHGCEASGASGKAEIEAGSVLGSGLRIVINISVSIWNAVKLSDERNPNSLPIRFWKEALESWHAVHVDTSIPRS